VVGRASAASPNRFLAARDGPAAELIDPVRARLVPVSNVVAELVTAAMPHALVLGAADELASDLAARFAPPVTARR
jgi:gamma-glutamyl:cysteine ligase YbdK (ATP-grasp superfamily)